MSVDPQAAPQSNCETRLHPTPHGTCIVVITDPDTGNSVVLGEYPIAPDPLPVCANCGGIVVESTPHLPLGSVRWDDGTGENTRILHKACAAAEAELITPSEASYE